MYQISLQWKEFNIDLSAFVASIKASYPTCAGAQGSHTLELWFSEDPSQEDKDVIQAMWDAIDTDHAMAQSYKSAAQIKSEREVQKVSARAKLAALGLSEAELQALLG
jgi:hypothetical protein